MNEVKITITGNGATFGAITTGIKSLLESLGADVLLELDDESAIIPIEEAEKYIGQVKNRYITIETKSLPWGG